MRVTFGDPGRSNAPDWPPELHGLSFFAAIRSAGTGGSTAIERTSAADIERLAIAPRILELRCKELVIASGRRRNSFRKSAIVWIAREFDKTDTHAFLLSPTRQMCCHT